mmetsp:Transcript_31691/g.79993  ORF Transcript_31691/g.79993 Transcript_31691/m.79993 type:complete len:850 (+) Transcript_31691:86-2635(+)
MNIEVTVHCAHLFKIVGTGKETQHVYVQLSRMLPDRREQKFARTLNCNGVGQAPQWDEKFIVAPNNGTALVLKVYCEHGHVLCGRAEIDLVRLAARIGNGEKFTSQEQLKVGSQTGTVLCSFAPVANVSLCDGVPAHLPPPDKFQAELAKLIHRPEELEGRVRRRFQENAKADRNGKHVMRAEDCNFLGQLLSDKLRVPVETFGEIGQMFYRYVDSAEGLLYEDGAVRMVLYMLHRYWDAQQGPTARARQPARSIKTCHLAEQYEVMKVLGRGGQGVAKLARNRSTNREEVVKIYAKANQREPVEHIAKEFELLLELKHPKIAHVFDIFQDYNNVYIAQEPYYGGDLHTAVQKAYHAGVRIDERWLAGIFHQVLTGCEFLHSNGVMHSDLKEGNVMVVDPRDWHRPLIVIIDFGLAASFDSRTGRGGTPGYMPPEVWESGLWTPFGDVFSIAVMMFAMRTGQQPFANPRGKNDIDEFRERTRTHEPVMQQASPEMQSLVRSMLDKNFLQRPTAHKVLEDRWFSAVDNSHPLDDQDLKALVNKGKQTDLRRALLTDVAARQNVSQLKDLNETFLGLDANNDGIISEDELRAGLAGRWQEDEIKRLIDVMDIKSSGGVSYEELVGQLLAAREPEENEILLRVFREADANNDGFISPQELEELATRPGVVKVLGSSEVALQKLKSIVPADGGVVTFEMFKRAVQCANPSSHQATSAAYQAGQMVKYLSHTFGGWILTEVTHADGVSGAVQIKCKPNHWLAGEELQRLLRPVTIQESRRGYREGQEVIMKSPTSKAWIVCKVTRVHVESGAVQVDQRPNHWFMGHELETSLQPMPASLATPQPQVVRPVVRVG